MLEQQVLDLLRAEVLAAPQDHVLGAARDPQVALLVGHREVAGAKPAVGR